MMNGHSFLGPVLISCYIISIVWGQCLNGNENDCVWSDDPSQPLRWIQKRGADERWVELTKCPSPCGKAVLMSPWLPPRDREISWIMRHKLFGHQKVTLQLSMKTEDSGPRQLFFEKGNYADGFPEFWKASKVVLPPVGKRHRLLLEAVTPYTDALVAVADVRTEDQLGSLQAGFGGHPDLRRGYTVIMDPNICMYP